MLLNILDRFGVYGKQQVFHRGFSLFFGVVLDVFFGFSDGFIYSLFKPIVILVNEYLGKPRSVHRFFFGVFDGINFFAVFVGIGLPRC